MTEASDQAVRELAHEILARPEYAAAHGPSESELVWLRALEWLLSLLRSFEALRLSDPLLYWSIVAALTLLAALLLAHIVWAIACALRFEPAPERTPAGVERPDLALEAERLAGQGRHLEAAHCLLLAALERLARAGWIDLQPEHTNRVVRARLGASRLPGGLGAELVELIAATERNWFRERSDDPDLYGRWRTAYGRIAGMTQ